MRRIYIMAGATVLLVILALAAGFGFSTGWAVRALEAEAQAQLGRSLSVTGGASLEFSPRLALRFDGVALGNPEGFEGSFASAKSLRIPMSLSDILQRRLAGRIEISEAEVVFEVNLKGDVSWLGAGEALAVPHTESLLIEKSTVRFFDQRNQQSIVIPGLDLAMTLLPDGELSARGTAILGGRVAAVDFHAKDILRIAKGGTPVDVAIDAPLLKAVFNGRLSTRGALNLAGPATFEGPSLADAMAWTGMTVRGLRGLGPFSLSGNLESSGIDVTLHNASVALEGLSASGDIGLTANRLKPLLFAKLALPTLDLDDFVDAIDPRAAGWNDQPLSYAGLRNLGVRASLAVENLSLGAMMAESAMVEASLADGRLATVIESANLAGGRSRIDFELDGTSESPLFSARFVSNGAKSDELLRQFTGQEWISGAVDADVSVSGFGPSVAAIVSTLKGTATFKVTEGNLKGLDVGKLMSAVTQRIVEGWGKAGEATAFESLSASFAITDGIAETKDLRFSGPDASVTATGIVDLLRRAIDLSVLPQIKGGDGQMIGLPVPIVTKGPWLKPRIYPDIADILLKPDEGFARMKELGLPQVPVSGD